MEVHAHTHPAPGGTRKKWTHYFWEFFMLFLAVTAGFFVENQREHLVEHKREHQYMQSMVQDLNADTNKLAGIARDHGRVIAGLDSLLNHYDEFASGNFSPVFYKSQLALNGFTDFQYTDRTIEQLKNSGGMRLIRKQAASDSIISYDDDARDFLLEQDGLQRLFELMSNELYQLFNFRLLEQEIIKKNKNSETQSGTNYPDLLLTHDKQKIEGFYNLLTSYRNTLAGKREAAGLLKYKAARLITFLENEYHLH